LISNKADKDHTHNYLPLTGGTIDGTLSLSTCNSFRARHVDGSTDGYNGELYLNYNSPDASIFLGSDGYRIANNGSYYSGTSANADMVDGCHAYQMAGWSDNRYINTIPNDYNGKLEVKGLKSNTSINSPDNSSFSTVLGLRAWHDYTGGDAHELAFTAKGQMFQRHGSTDSWSKWNMVYTSENITYGTSALTPGSSALATGHIYLQYE